MSVILQVENLGKVFIMHHFNQKKIVGCKSVSFFVHEGEFVGITGKSGTGKSTVLKCIYRTYIPTSGRILFQSKLFGKIDLAQSDDQAIISIRHKEIGYVSQFLNVLPRVTALNVVAEGLIKMGYDYERAVNQAKNMLRYFQIPENLWDAYPNTFSGGEKLRLNLARAMIKRPRLLLLDEPTASLDNQSKGPVKEMILELKRSGTSMVGIFHDIEFMKDIVDTSYTMKQGYLKEGIMV